MFNIPNDNCIHIITVQKLKMQGFITILTTLFCCFVLRTKSSTLYNEMQIYANKMKIQIDILFKEINKYK